MLSVSLTSTLSDYISGKPQALSLFLVPDPTKSDSTEGSTLPASRQIDDRDVGEEHLTPGSAKYHSCTYWFSINELVNIIYFRVIVLSMHVTLFFCLTHEENGT